MFSKYNSCLYSIRTEVFFVFFTWIATLYIRKELKIRWIYLASHKRCLLQVKEKVLGIFFFIEFLVVDYLLHWEEICVFSWYVCAYIFPKQMLLNVHLNMHWRMQISNIYWDFVSFLYSICFSTVYFYPFIYCKDNWSRLQLNILVNRIV